MRLGSGKSSGKLQAAERNTEHKNEKACWGAFRITEQIKEAKVGLQIIMFLLSVFGFVFCF